MTNALPPGAGSLPVAWSDPVATDEQPWTAYLRPILTRWRVFLAVFTVIVTGALVATLLTPKTYTTTAKLLIGSSTDPTHQADPNTVLPMLNVLLTMSGQQSAETYAELLTEPPIAQEVIKDLGLPTTPKALIADVSVKPVTNTAIMGISVTSRSPKLSAAIANDFAHVFVKREHMLLGSQADDAIAGLQSELPDAERNMMNAQHQVVAEESKLHIPDATIAKQNLLDQATSIDKDLAQARLDKAQAEAKLRDANAQLASLPNKVENGTTVAPNPVMAQLLAQRAQAEVQLQTMLRQYTSAYPGITSQRAQLAQIDNEIARTKQMIVASRSTASNPVYEQLREQAAGYQATVQSSAAQIAELQSERQQLAPSLGGLQAQTYRLAQLESRAKLAEDVYSEMKRKLAEASVAKMSGLSDVSVVAPAIPELATRSPKILFNLAIACLLALIAAATAVYAGELFDKTVKGERDVGQLFGLPVLASIPQLEGLPSNPGSKAVTNSKAPRLALGATLSSLFRRPRTALPATKPSSENATDLVELNEEDLLQHVFVESFLQLVASLNYASDMPLRSVSITSPLPNEGKSTIAYNTAVAVAEIRPRVLLIDADMRRPTLHERLRIPKRNGLSDVLVGTLSLSEAVRRAPLSGLDVMTSGTSTPNPIKLLQSERFERMLDEARRTYSLVIVDGPALNTVFDGAVIASKTDGTVLVASSGETEVKQMRRALYRLTTSKAKQVLGVVLNRTTVRSNDERLSYYGLDEDRMALPQA